ncbi:MAG TPA: HEAT repeat domain-containing protein [Pirellulales bacterium]|nr:HEAT repeat domain-containing protein [Pirellulales bacterium]
MSNYETIDAASPDDHLPPVEPPNAGFIVQLFVIPALIVVIMFALGGGIKWLVERDNNPEAYVDALRRNNDARWQAAHDLADVLRNPRNAKLKDDARLAEQLAGILNKELDEGSLDKNPIELRIYLCHLLGEFHSPEVLDVLLKAAGTERDAAESAVRFAAMKALAVWLDGSPHDKTVVERRLMPAILAASRDERPLLRSTAAFALGAADTPEATKRLERMLVDSYPDVRYNAATMLARHGDTRAVEVLAEMLDERQTSSLEKEEQAEARDYKRDLIVVNALRATKDLAEKNPAADLAPLAEAVERLSGSELPAAIRVQAKDVSIELNQRRK